MKVLSRVSLINFLVCCLFSIGCISNAQETSKVISIAEFTGISLNMSNNVIIKQGDIQEVIVTGDISVINHLKTSVSNDIWSIKFDRSYFRQKDLSIDINGSGKVLLNEIEGLRALEVSISGSGIVYANKEISSVNRIDIEISGSGKYLGFAIAAKKCYVDISGSGKCELTSHNTLNVEISGSGKVVYKGTPVVSTEISGSGKLVESN